MRELRILFAPQLVQIAESDQADEGPHPAGDVEHQRMDVGEGVHDQTSRAPGNQHDDGARQHITHDSSLMTGRHDAARLWLGMRKLRDFGQRGRAAPIDKISATLRSSWLQFSRYN